MYARSVGWPNYSLHFLLEDPGAAARLLKDFAKEKEEFEIKALAVGGELLGADQIDRLAKLPTRDQALAMLAECIASTYYETCTYFQRSSVESYTRSCCSSRSEERRSLIHIFVILLTFRRIESCLYLKTIF